MRIPATAGLAMALLSVFAPKSSAQERVVVIFLIDGMAPITAKTAAENGAVNLKFIMDSGVVADTVYCPTPADRITLEDGSEPWGGTTGPNVSVHTGTHMFESRDMDDIFLAAREKGIQSVYAGGATNYSVFTTADFHYAGNHSDEFVVQKGIDHFQEDGTRLIRLHLQRIRDHWDGPEGRTDPASGYIKAVVAADAQLGRLIQVLKEGGVWDSTFLIVAADHGMGSGGSSNHPADVLSSWSIFAGFYGPGIKRGATIPYAENPDFAILAAHMLGLRQLRGHLDPDVSAAPKGPTGTFLANIFEGAPRNINHPRPIQAYLESTDMEPGDSYLDYRNGVMQFLVPTTGLAGYRYTSAAMSMRLQALVPGRITAIVTSGDLRGPFRNVLGKRVVGERLGLRF